MGGRGGYSASAKGGAKKAGTAKSKTQKGHLVGNDWGVSKVAEYLGVPKKKANDYINAVLGYSEADYTIIRDIQRGSLGGLESFPPFARKAYEKKAKDLESFIGKSPKWAGGKTYRGISLSDSDVAKIKVGKTFDVNGGGSASWSTDPGVADAFASTFGRKGHRSVIFVSPTQRKGTSIKHLSGNEDEDEVLVSKSARYTVSRIEKASDTTYVYVKEV